MVKYTSKIPAENGLIAFDAVENETWRILYARQLDLIKGRACSEFFDGLAAVQFDPNKIPQCPEMDEKLQAHTGWTVQPVPALIPTDEFYTLLFNKKFPAATFIRVREELDYLKEPDLFHEYFGHCPLLTNQAYADFMHWYAKNALSYPCHKKRNLLLRLFWYTIEFGLFKTDQGFCVYGGGILSSPAEMVYATESPEPERRPFVLEDVLRTPYRYDIMQPIYYCLNGFSDLYALMALDLAPYLDEALAKGDFEPHPKLIAAKGGKAKEEKAC